MLRTVVRCSVGVIVIALAVSLPASPASAIVHLAEVHEIMVGADGDPDVQFIEINMRLGGQNITNGSHLASFDSSGSFSSLLITFSGNVPNGGDGVRWIVGTSEFESASGITADFVIPASPGLPAGAGMVCLFEAFRDFTDPVGSVDCLAYGGAGFTGSNPNSSPSEAATTGPGDGAKSLTRIVPASLFGAAPWARGDQANDFALRCPTPENNAGEIGVLGADGDSDGLPDCHENELGTDVSDPDTDDDGCQDGAEVGNDETLGGLRDPLNPWDFYDVAGANLGPPDQQVDLFNDIVSVIDHYAPVGNEPEYDAFFDRGPSAGPNAWNMTAPDDKIDLFNDIVGVINQFGHDCR